MAKTIKNLEVFNLPGREISPLISEFFKQKYILCDKKHGKTKFKIPGSREYAYFLEGGIAMYDYIADEHLNKQKCQWQKT